MKEIKLVMLEVFRDAEYQSLHPETRKALEVAIVRFDHLELGIARIMSMHATEFQWSQQSNWLKMSGGVWLTRQIDRFPRCANS